MILRNRHTIYLILSLLICSSSSLSQTAPFAKSTVDKNKILLGEQLQLTLQAKFPVREPISFFDIDTIPHFEILQRQKIDTNDNRVEIELKQILLLTSFDSGHWVIPSFQLAARKSLVTDSIPVDVSFSSPFDPKQPYHDIKDVIDVEVKKEKQTNWYWFAAGGFLVLLILIYLLTRKKKPVPKAVDIDAYREAKTQLAILQKETMTAKMFFTKLVDIFRWYLQRRTAIVSFEQTTTDLVDQLRSLNLDDGTYNTLVQALMLSDFVKFARYEPTEREKKTSFDVIANSIEKIEAESKKKVSVK